MSKSQRLRLQDVREGMRLVCECRELWADPAAWREHLLCGLRELTDSQVAVYLELADLKPGRPLNFACSASVGWADPAHHQAYDQAREDGRLDNHPGGQAALDQLWRDGKATGRRCQWVDDAAWYRSDFFHEVRAPTGRDDFAASFRFIEPSGQSEPNGRRANLININRGLDEPNLDARQTQLLGMVHDELSPLIGSWLTTERHRSLAGLSRRQKQVLSRILRGHSEKEVARELGISGSTTHDHLKALHAHFDVTSRAELLAYFVQKQPRHRA